ncbi:MAG: hypothetical protein U9R43_00505 [Thermodesulfobacteriota bacterium]|nr:hypothetical protein [Thermodesulfobacteriota bacterium]
MRPFSTGMEARALGAAFCSKKKARPEQSRAYRPTFSSTSVLWL